MSKDSNDTEYSATSWRLVLGISIFLLSIFLPILGIPLLALLNLSAAVTASISGGMLIGAELLGIAAVAIMGKSGFTFIKNRIFGFLKQYGPPDEVSRIRYTIGLVMFCLPLLFGWISIYTYELIPDFANNPVPYAVAGDIFLVASLFVLGGDFWDKIRALFIYNAKASFLVESK